MINAEDNTYNTTPLYVQPLHADSVLPQKMTDGAAAFDVCSYTAGRDVKTWQQTDDGFEISYTETPDQELILEPMQRAIIPTGLKVCCEPGYCIKAYPRSGLSVKNGLTLVNNAALIDSDYRDELFILVINLSGADQVIKHGERIAQIKVEKLVDTEMVVGDLPATDSNRAGGLGSTSK